MNNESMSRLLEYLPSLYEARTLDLFSRYMPGFFGRLIRADAVAYNEVDVNRRQIIAVTDRPEILNPEFIRAFEAYLHQHPLIRHQQETGDLSAHKISDFLSRTQYHRLELYQEVYRRVGAEDQFALSLKMAGERIVAVAMNRGRRSFTEADRRVLNLLQPHLIQAHRNAETATFLQTELDRAHGALEMLPAGLIVVGPGFRMMCVTERAWDLLRKHCRHPRWQSTLPDPLKSWLTHAGNWKGKPLPNAHESLVMDSAAGTLRVRQCKLPERFQDETLLLLDESSAAPSVPDLLSSGLTTRQAEVLVWIAQGKSNQEIATILGIAPRTIQKHVEHIFEKLGVESRTAAARRAVELSRKL